MKRTKKAIKTPEQKLRKIQANDRRFLMAQGFTHQIILANLYEQYLKAYKAGTLKKDWMILSMDKMRVSTGFAIFGIERNYKDLVKEGLIKHRRGDADMHRVQLNYAAVLHYYETHVDRSLSEVVRKENF